MEKAKNAKNALARAREKVRESHPSAESVTHSDKDGKGFDMNGEENSGDMKGKGGKCF